MPDYIKREDAFNAIAEQYHIRTQVQLEALKEALAKVPTADVELRRGRWKTVYLDHEAFGVRPKAHYCSECHQITWFRTFYCPNCGAKMEEEKA